MSLIGPLKYLRIWHPSKFVIDFIIPLSFAAVVFLVRLTTNETAGLGGDRGLFSLLIPLLGALSGFYIAALTAISAFPIASLDQEMPGDHIKLLGQKSYDGNPTRRTFLALQFGYLSLISIFLFIVCLLGVYLDQPLSKIPEIVLFEIEIGAIVTWSFLFFILFCVANLISVTLFSLYYLSDRIHRFEPELKGGPDNRKPAPKVQTFE